MVVNELIQRECCDWNASDLVPLVLTGYRDSLPLEVMCVYCDKVHVLARTTDAAGSGEWDYKPVPFSAEYPRPVCILNLDSPSYPPEPDEFVQCSCASCLNRIERRCKKCGVIESEHGLSRTHVFTR